MTPRHLRWVVLQPLVAAPFAGQRAREAGPAQQAAEVMQRLRNPAAVVVQVPEFQVEGAHQGKDALQVGGVAAAEAD